MGKMPILWHHRVGIQGLKSVTAASRSNQAFVAQCANTSHFQAHTKRRFSPPAILFILVSLWNFACLVYSRIETEWLLFLLEECREK
jgi:hypothetical protein